MIDVSSYNSKSFEVEFVRVLASKVLNEWNLENSNMEINLITDKEMQRINREYRQQDKVTDVLAFSYEDNKERLSVIGELFLCPSYIDNQAKNYKKEYQEELAEVLIHGILHLLGHDHENVTDEKKQEMLNKQKELLVKYYKDE
ncbi:MAG: rRNA maturation RNase YbeY [bacterium]